MQLQFSSDRETAVLTEPFSVDIPSVGTITVPVGYETDGRSIPRGLWWLTGHPFEGRYLPAAVVHDWLCDAARQQGNYGLRVLADAVFFYVLEQTPGVNRFLRASMYLAVRGYGRWAFKPVRRAGR